jgi:hypothetical protein
VGACSTSQYGQYTSIERGIDDPATTSALNAGSSSNARSEKSNRPQSNQPPSSKSQKKSKNAQIEGNGNEDESKAEDEDRNEQDELEVQPGEDKDDYEGVDLLDEFEVTYSVVIKQINLISLRIRFHSNLSGHKARVAKP